MRISRVFRVRQAIVRVLILPLLIWCTDVPALAKVLPDEQIRLSVKGVEVKGEIILISYELFVSVKEECVVSIVLLKEKDPSIKIPVRFASGDLGEATYVSGAKQVKWEYKKDVPLGLWGEGFYFEVTISRVSGTSVWWYIGIGAALAGGGALLVAGKKSGGGPSTPTVLDLPFPPNRPSN